MLSTPAQLQNRHEESKNPLIRKHTNSKVSTSTPQVPGFEAQVLQLQARRTKAQESRMRIDATLRRRQRDIVHGSISNLGAGNPVEEREHRAALARSYKAEKEAQQREFQELEHELDEESEENFDLEREGSELVEKYAMPAVSGAIAGLGLAGGLLQLQKRRPLNRFLTKKLLLLMTTAVCGYCRYNYTKEEEEKQYEHTKKFRESIEAEKEITEQISQSKLDKTEEEKAKKKALNDKLLLIRDEKYDDERVREKEFNEILQRLENDSPSRDHPSIRLLMTNMLAVGDMSEKAYKDRMSVSAFLCPIRYLKDEMKSLRDIVELLKRRLDLTDSAARTDSLITKSNSELTDWLKKLKAPEYTVESIKEDCKARISQITEEYKAELSQRASDFLAEVERVGRSEQYHISLNERTAKLESTLITENYNLDAYDTKLQGQLTSRKFREMAHDSGITLPFPTIDKEGKYEEFRYNNFAGKGFDYIDISS